MTVTVNVRGIDEAIRQLEEYGNRVERAGAEIVSRLALIGYDVAYTVMSTHIYSGETIGSLTIVENDPTHYTLLASSTALLFFEFGAGANGSGHPQAAEFGFGPGTYPGQTHAFDPNGWWYPTDDDQLAVRIDSQGRGWAHSYGNPPHMPFYKASVKMRKDLEQVAREVLQGD